MSWKHIDTSIDDAISELAKAIGDGSEEGLSQIIPSGANLNDYKTSGFYSAAGNSTSGNGITNAPANSTYFGLLVIRKAPQSGACMQICFASINNNLADHKPRIYLRHYTATSDTWGDWQEVPAPVIKLDGNENLNDITFSGFYTCAGNNTCTNTPVSTGKTFGLQVVRLAPTTDYLMQFCYSTSATQGHYSVWCRCLAGSTWTAWEKMYTYGEPAKGGGGGITEESDPVFMAHVAHTITQAMIDAWNAKGTSNLTIGTLATQAAAGNHNHDGVYLKGYTEQYTGTVKKVNGQSPNSSGEVTITIPGAITETDVSGWGFIKSEQYTGTVKSVNNTSPDANGNVSLTIPSAVTDSTVSGWGYIKSATLGSSVNLNDYKTTGFYIAPNSNSITNRPGTSTNSFGLLVIKRNPVADYVTQIAFYGGTDTIVQYERICTNGTWSAWYDISLNNYYTKTEVDSLVGDVETLINAL